MIQTVREFMTVLGFDNGAASAFFKVSEPAICNWKADDRFPSWVHAKVLAVAQEKKLTVSPELLEARPPGNAAKPKQKAKRVKARPVS